MNKAIRKRSSLFESIVWTRIAKSMKEKGYAHVAGVLPDEICEEFIANYDLLIYRKTVTMERHRFGLGEYKYFDDPLPPLVRTARETIYPHLAPIANVWME